MKKRFIRISSVSVVLLLLSILSFGQNDNRTVSSAAGNLYVISAKAGGVNLIEGNVFVERESSRTNRLIKGDNVEVGEKVVTDKNSKAEILLNPGSYARLGENTEFEFGTTSLDDLKLHMNRGSAIFEVYATKDFKITLTSPNSRFYLVDSGIYKLDVLENGGGRLQVWKGKAQVGDINSTKVKKSREVIVNGSQVAVSKFDRDEKDSFDEWSQDRAKELAKANARLERNTLRTSLVNSFSNNRWGGFNTYGLWAFDASFGGYCFLPFNYGWRSPYGYWLDRNFFSSRPSNSFYYRVYRRTYRNVNTGGNNNNGANRGTPPTGNRPRTGNLGNSPINRGRVNPSGMITPTQRVNPMPTTVPRSSSPAPIRGPGRVRTPTIDN